MRNRGNIKKGMIDLNKEELMWISIIFLSVIGILFIWAVTSDGYEIEGRPATNTTTSSITGQTNNAKITTNKATTTTKKTTKKQKVSKTATSTSQTDTQTTMQTTELITETAETSAETEVTETLAEAEIAEYSEPSYYGDYSPYDLQTMGVISWGGYRYTYYSELVLPGYGLAIEGRHVDEYGFVCDGNGYICVASSSLPWGTVVDTPFGRQGKVYDSGCAWDVIDCYVHW